MCADVRLWSYDYAHSAEVLAPERWLFLAGTIGLYDGGVPRATLAEQLELVWANLRAILAAPAMTVDHLVRVTSYLRDVAFADENTTARLAAFGGRPFRPPRSSSARCLTSWLVEIEHRQLAPRRSYPRASMRLLVTGGAGYIGSIVAQQLLARGDDVDRPRLALSAATAPPCPEGAASSRSTCSTPTRRRGALRARVRRRPALRRALARRRVRGAPERYWRGNVVGRSTCSTRCARPACTRLVFSSTSATYGEPDVGPITEDTPTAPGQRLRQLEARGRPDARRRGARARARRGLAALLQRRGRERARWARTTSPRRT